MSDRDGLRALDALLTDVLGPRECPVSAPLAPLAAQLDLDGAAHEIAPQTRQERLFAPAPNQLAGQTFVDTDTERQER